MAWKSLGLGFRVSVSFWACRAGTVIWLLNPCYTDQAASMCFLCSVRTLGFEVGVDSLFEKCL